MKFANLSKVVGAGVIAASLAVVPLTLPAHAQNSGTDTNTQNTQTNSDVRDVETENDFNWGWLGLLGLAGLAGLAGKKRHETHRISNDPNVVVRSGSDYR
jgi:hypothetical protein